LVAEALSRADSEERSQALAERSMGPGEPARAGRLSPRAEIHVWLMGRQEPFPARAAGLWMSRADSKERSQAQALVERSMGQGEHFPAWAGRLSPRADGEESPMTSNHEVRAMARDIAEGPDSRHYASSH